MKTQEYLDAVREKLNLPSDYALQKTLGVSKQLISRYRTGKDVFSDDVSMKIAEILGMHAGLVILDMHKERAKTPQERGIWQEIFRGFLTLSLRAKSGRRLALPR